MHPQTGRRAFIIGLFVASVIVGIVVYFVGINGGFFGPIPGVTPP